ncbi:hypothetical protein R6Q59_010596 [Mikania micrantha]
MQKSCLVESTECEIAVRRTLSSRPTQSCVVGGVTECDDDMNATGSGSGSDGSQVELLCSTTLLTDLLTTKVVQSSDPDPVAGDPPIS